MQVSLVKNIIIVASGTLGAQAIGMAFIPFITRIYGPEVYGTFGIFISLTAVITMLTTLAYPVAIVLPESDSVAKSIIKLSLIIATITSLMVALVIWVAGGWVLLKLGAINLMGFLFFIPLVMFLTACQDITQQWLIRKKYFKGIAKISIIHSLINYGSQAAAGVYAPLGFVLVTIHTLSIAVRGFLAAYMGKNLADIKTTEDSELKSLKKIAYKYKDFPLYRAPQMVLYAASQSVPVMILAFFFGAASVGFYTLTRTVLNLPINLLGSSVQSVFYPNFNEAFLQGREIKPMLITTIVSLACIGFPPFIIIITLGPYLFDNIFGSDWHQAGKYSQWISVWMFFYLLERPVVSAVPVFGLQRWFLFFEILSLIFRVLTLYLSFYFLKDDVSVIAALSMISACLSIFLIVKIIGLSTKIDKRTLDFNRSL